MMKGLVDDFPRVLSQLERSRVARQLNEVLAQFPQPVSDNPTKKVPPLAGNVEIVLKSLEKWPTRLAVNNLHQLGDLSKLMNDERMMKFINHLTPSLLSTDLLVRTIALLPRGSPKHVSVLRELVSVRELEGLSQSELLVVADNLIPEFAAPLIERAKRDMDPQILLRLVPLGHAKGEMIFPDFLLPLLTKPELIRLLQMLEPCEFPAVIARTVGQVSDHLTRLSFRRLVKDEDRAELLVILAKLKVKLDTMVFVEGNPFYDKSRHSFLSKLLGTLSSDFHHTAISLPITAASERMMALTCVNKLQLKSVDLIANRISAFGEKLLAPSSVDSSVFTNILYAMTRHPASWKRKDRYRSLVGPQLAKLLISHIQEGKMNHRQMLSCSESLMRIHNKRIRGAVGLALRQLNPSSLSPAALVSGISLSSVLLKHEEPSLTLPTVQGFIEALNFQSLNTPHLVHVLDALRQGRLVSRTSELVGVITARLSENGGLISPSNSVRVIAAIGELQIRNCDEALLLLSQCLPESSALHPRLVSRLISGLLLAGVANPHCMQSIQSLIHENLLSISVPDRLEIVAENKQTAGELVKTVKLAGPAGAHFMNHLALVPGSSDTSASLASLLTENVTENPSVSHDEWKGLLPPSTAFLEDILGALVATESDYLGGFQLSDPYTWVNEKEEIMLSVVRPKHCARDDPKRILGAVTRDIALRRQAGWKVIVMPQQALESASVVDRDTLRKRVRRAKILFQNVEDPHLKLQSQMKEILSPS